MTTPVFPERLRFWMYVAGFAAWAIVMGADAYFSRLGEQAPDVVIGSQGVIEWLIGAGLLTAATHTSRQPGEHRADAEV